MLLFLFFCEQGNSLICKSFNDILSIRYVLPSWLLVIIHAGVLHIDFVCGNELDL